MPLMPVGWLFIVILVAMSPLLILALRTWQSRSERLDPASRIAPLKIEMHNAAGISPAASPLVDRLRSSISVFSHDVQGAGGTLIGPALVFLLFVGIGAAAPYIRNPPALTGAMDPVVFSPSESNANDAFANLESYARAIGGQEPASTAEDAKPLPDVNTMIDRLAARLEAAPNDIAGWRMLGWSYFQIARFDHAANALAKAIDLDPSSAELKQLYEEAKAKVAGSSAALQPKGVGASVVGPRGAEIDEPLAMSPHDKDAAIRQMVDGLADRLKSAPRDVEGWTRLIRSRIVLGEKDVAAQTVRKALEIFKDDSAASVQINAEATDLGLKVQ